MFTALLICENKLLFLPATSSMILFFSLAERWEYCAVYSVSLSFNRYKYIAILWWGTDV